METVFLSNRLSHRYIDSYSHLDAWKDVGIARLTPPKRVREASDFDDGGAFVRNVTLPRGQDVKRSLKALESLYMSNCRHEWDCCGCAIYQTDVIRTGKRTAIMKVDVGYNY